MLHRHYIKGWRVKNGHMLSRNVEGAGIFLHTMSPIIPSMGDNVQNLMTLQIESQNQYQDISMATLLCSLLSFHTNLHGIP